MNIGSKDSSCKCGSCVECFSGHASGMSANASPINKVRIQSVNLYETTQKRIKLYAQFEILDKKAWKQTVCAEYTDGTESGMCY